MAAGDLADLVSQGKDFALEMETPDDPLRCNPTSGMKVDRRAKKVLKGQLKDWRVEINTQFQIIDTILLLANADPEAPNKETNPFPKMH